MCQYSSENGGPTDWHLVHLGKFATGGAGIIFCEETAIQAMGRKTYGCAGIYDNQFLPAYRRITDFLRGQGAVPAIQLGHAGRRASSKPPWTNFSPLNDADAAKGAPPWSTVSASAVPSRVGASTPVALSSAEIRGIVAAWREAAERSLEAGFDICEIHGAHGYLIHQFLSPLANRRTDSYGGDLANRMRFALEVATAVRGVWPREKPVFFRLSAVDGDSGMWTMDDTVSLAKALKAIGIDVITCSSGGIAGAPNMAIIPRTPGYQVGFAAQVRQEAQMMSCAVGLITEPAQAEEILQRGQADLVALAREFLYNPNWPVHAAKALGVPDYLDLLPREYAWWLKRRETVRQLNLDASADSATGLS